MKDIDQDFYLNKPEPIQGCLLFLRKILLAQDDLVHETRKYGMPCFCYKKKAFCYLWTHKETQQPYLLLVEGEHLQHPALKSDGRKRMKTFTLDPEKDLPIETIEGILQSAIALYKSGKIKA